jgi:hypothetical protein
VVIFVGYLIIGDDGGRSAAASADRGRHFRFCFQDFLGVLGGIIGLLMILNVLGQNITNKLALFHISLARPTEVMI